MNWQAPLDFLHRLRIWVVSLFARRPRLYLIENVHDEPDHFAAGIVYVISDAGHELAAAMACPGGCGQVLHMNLLNDTKPVWRLTRHLDRSVSLSPSVWRREGCGCHFWLRDGRIQWC